MIAYLACTASQTGSLLQYITLAKPIHHHYLLMSQHNSYGQANSFALSYFLIDSKKAVKYEESAREAMLLSNHVTQVSSSNVVQRLLNALKHEAFYALSGVVWCMLDSLLANFEINSLQPFVLLTLLFCRGLM